MSIDSPMDEISNAKKKVEDLESEMNNIDKKLKTLQTIDLIQSWLKFTIM